MGVPEYTHPFVHQHQLSQQSDPMELSQPQLSQPQAQSAQPVEQRQDHSDQLRSPTLYSNVVSAGEDCVAKIWDFCGAVLKIPNPRDKIQIDRAHRMGNSVPGKTRAIVVKLKDTESKSIIKSALKSINLKDTPYAVFDQYPKIVQDRRKELIPEMLRARRSGKTAFLIRDKLFVNNKPYRPSDNKHSGEECEFDLNILAWNVEGLTDALKDICCPNVCSTL